MPMYEYECGDCSHRFEKRQAFNAEASAICPKCSSDNCSRIMFPTPIIFKGSGFYVNDYPKNASTGAS